MANFYTTYYDKYFKLMFSEDIEKKFEEFKELEVNIKSNKNKLIFAGNGASASISAHGAVDFTKQAGVRSITFSDANMITAFSNDYGYEKWIEKGVTTLSQIVHEQDIITKETLSQKIGQYGGFIFDYYAMINAIPKEWKTKLKENTSEKNPQENNIKENTDIIQKGNKELRKLLNEKHHSRLWCLDMWQRKFGKDVSANLGIAQDATTESRLRLLHFKIIHKIYPTNILLHKMGIKSSDNCEECQTKDYMEHFFFHCKKLNGFWQHVLSIIYNKMQCKIPLTETNILFGITNIEHPHLSCILTK